MNRKSGPFHGEFPMMPALFDLSRHCCAFWFRRDGHAEAVGGTMRNAVWAVNGKWSPRRPMILTPPHAVWLRPSQ